MVRHVFIVMIPLMILLNAITWGFFGHKNINRMAVYTLPAGMIRFYKNNIVYLTEHAVDPDKRRYADSLEAPRHFIDADRYGSQPFDSIPKRWDDAVKKYSEAALRENGTVPWQIYRTYQSLVKAFAAKDSLKILRYSADLGHYVADAHVPLHTTENYNGQLTGQVGIHAFWESRLPELFFTDYNFWVGPARYISEPLQESWAIVQKAYSFKDSVLQIEKSMTSAWRADRKYSYSMRNSKIERQYSLEFSAAYHQRLRGMVEQQMRASVLATASYWYSAWLEAGQPILSGLPRSVPDSAELSELRKQNILFERGRILGRSEN